MSNNINFMTRHSMIPHNPITFLKVIVAATLIMVIGSAAVSKTMACTTNLHVLAISADQNGTVHNDNLAPSSSPIIMDTSPDVEEALDQAFALKDAFQDEEALEAFTNIVEKESDHYEALWNIVMLHTAIGNRQSSSSAEEAHYEKAKEYAERLLEAHPDSAGSHFAYSAAVGRMAQSAGARERLRLSTEIREHAERAVELDAEYSRAWNVLGNWHHRAANLSRMERFAANALFGGAPEGASNENAREAFKKAIEADPQYMLYYHDKAEFYITIDEEENARRVLLEGLEQDIITSDDERWRQNMQEMLNDL